jgi:hypothetical protein
MRSTVVPLLATVLLASVLLPREARAQAPPDTGRKSPVLAGVLGYVLPGVGSLYAGDKRNAAVHASIAIVTAAAIGISDVDKCNARDCSQTKNGFGLFLYVALLTNAVWSSVTAVHDANAHNERAERLRGTSLGLSPSVDVVRPGSAGGPPHVQMRVVQLTF